MSQPVVFFEILAIEQSTLKAFYSAVFGWQYTAGEKRRGKQFEYITPPFSDLQVRGGIGNAPANGSSRVNFYVQVDNLETTLAKVKKHGGQVAQKPIQIDGYSFATFHDPEGNTIGVVLPFPED